MESRTVIFNLEKLLTQGKEMTVFVRRLEKKLSS